MSPALDTGFLASALAPSGPKLVVLPAPPLAPLAILRSIRKGEAWLLERADETLLGLGAAEASALSSAPFPAIEAHRRRANARALVVHPDACPALAGRFPITLFGAAFEPGAGAAEPWLDHGDGRVVTPRFTLLRASERAVLAIAADGGLSPARLAVLVAELGALTSPTPAPHASAGSNAARLDPASAEPFLDAVEEAREAIARGALEKVVCARRVSVSSERDLVAEDVFERLPRASLRFLVRRGRSSLVGASPEHLFRKRGARLSSEALAGTRSDDEDAAALLASGKDRAEHAPVVRAIHDALVSLGARVAIDDAPRLRHAANVVHLRTAIEAELPPTVEATALLAALHPTPALGGSPREAAMAFIRAHEAPRGWYGGPLGTIDREGDAEVHVVLRAGVVRGARAFAFAGGGVVRSSDPRAELQETRLKLAPLLAALGVASPADAASSLEAGAPAATGEESVRVAREPACFGEASPEARA